MYTKFRNVEFTYHVKESNINKKGIFTNEDIKTGRILAKLDPFDYPPILNYINHSCTPNSALSENFSILAATKNIQVNEEITIDYRVLDPSKFLKFEFICHCGNCNNSTIKMD